MPDYYSEHFAALSSQTQAPARSALRAGHRAAPGIAHARVYRSQARVDFRATSVSIATSEVVRLFPLQSGDMVLDLRLSNQVAWAGTTLTCDVGLHTIGDSHDGTALDADLFASGEDLLTTHGQTDLLVTGAGSVTNSDRGIALWKMANLGGVTSYASDPFTTWDLTLTFQTVSSVTVKGIVLVECWYTSAGTN